MRQNIIILLCSLMYLSCNISNKKNVEGYDKFKSRIEHAKKENIIKRILIDGFIRENEKIIKIFVKD